MNNTGDRGFGGRGGFGGGGQGLSAPKMFGMNYNYEIKDKLKVDFSARYNHNDTDNNTITSTENFVSKTGSFGNSVSQNYSRSNSWNMSGRLEWKPDTLTTIQIRPSFSTSKNDGRSKSINATFNRDPYSFDGVTDPMDSVMMNAIERATDYKFRVNRRENKSLSYGTSTSFNVNATVNRRQK